MKNRSFFLLFSFCMTLLFESCDYVCSYEFEIQNNTENEVFISTTPLINSYSVVIDNYYVNSDNRVKYEVGENDTQFVIPSKFALRASVQWESKHSLKNTPKEDGVVPLWEIFTEIKVNGEPLNNNLWNKQELWNCKSYSDDYMRKYTLCIE